MSDFKVSKLNNAIEALSKAGYDTHEMATGTIYIADCAPCSDDYDGNTEPGSEWDEACDEILDEIQSHLPNGVVAFWSDDDVVIEVAA